jgi:hypothetical protein
MLAFINPGDPLDTFYFADGSLSGGVALSNLRLRCERMFDVVMPLRAALPVLISRFDRKTEVMFSVKRCHASIKEAEQYIQEHEATVPQSGDIVLTTVGGVVGHIPNGVLLSLELIHQIGSTTEHAYHIIGGPMEETPSVDEFILLETVVDYILLESGFGDKIQLE